MNGDDFVDQIQDVQKRVAELQEDASQLPLQQKSRLTESLERLTTALRDLQVAEEAIRLLLSAVQQSRDSIIITTAHLNPPGPEIVYVNPAFSEMTGYDTHEVLGKTPRILQGSDTDRNLLDDLRQHLEDGEPFHGEAINYRKDGTEFYVEWNITPIRNVNQQVTHFVAIQRNISDRKQLEVEREYLLEQEHSARNQAEAANRTKDEFLATLSHELRTPLTPILGWSKVLQTKKLPQAKLQEALATIEQNAKRQAQLVDDLLDLSRIVQGKLSLDLTKVNLSEPIAAALETVRPAADAKSIAIATQFAVSDAIVLGDAGRLQQIVWNLLSNAIKFTPTSGKVKVKLSVRDASTPHSLAEITVCDTGKGIDPNFLPYVFDRFRQEDSSITRQFGGLGLGLSLVRQLVEAHGGTIAAESAGVGKGATFTVRLPLIAQSIEPDPEPPADLKFHLQNVRVLIVEDEPSTLQFLAFLLEQEGAIVTAMPSASDALEHLKRSPFDLLISDIAMQEMDGYKLIEQVRSLDSCSDSLPDSNAKIPAIALTAYTAQSEHDQAISVGFQQHLAKPIEPEALIHAAAIALGRPVNAIT
ncbi:response regulator [Microcoleus sp. FACHB-1515]|uniref:hybrid sensor histidine kinase/response regulator n=1 Tax=Cyanophyceae TaxID=3028117 RepID=UPI001684C87F|nr:ATP-binding protein [Microcoleus sp. FACHB-1515]MBD2089909.1 response regulator [Microcoleus sp. FACHB-1515]